ncbi:MAG TPA: aminotransferase class V-fold PLP-dependent enzyme [Actinobacteria bacterium]|nr:aminotransferase class V-fold PLP-dependent enzyme [Actinomycetota bacterium]
MSFPDWTVEEFRRHGYAAIDWICDYLERVEELPVVPKVAPGDLRALLPERAPEEAEPFEEILADLDRVVLPGITHWQHPGWFAYFPTGASPPSILGDLVSSGLGVVGFLWASSPAATELEAHVMDWLVDLLGLPQGWKTTDRGGGVIQVSASDATHLAFVVARHRRRDVAAVEDMVVYASEEAHSSVAKGARVAGFTHVRWIPVDDRFALVPTALEEAIGEDLAAGRTPVAVVSTVGTTGTTAVDPVRAVGELARRHGLWHHVDAAYAGTAMICPEFRGHQDGLELADSYVFNPHKWMLTNFDCSAFWVADRAPLIEAMSILPPYLRNRASESGEVIDYRDWQVPLGRRFRALKLWFVLRAYGAAGIRAMVRHHVELARGLAERLDADPRFTLVAPTPFALVTFRHVGGDAPTEALAAALDDTGEVHVTPSRDAEGAFIRVAIGQRTTRARHVDRLWELVDALAEPVR